MGEAIGQSLSLAVGVALSPVPIIAVILMLVTRRARTNGPLFVIGWLIGLGLTLDVRPPLVLIVVTIVAGLALGVLVYRTDYRPPRRRGSGVPPPAARARSEDVGRRAGRAVGRGIRAYKRRDRS